MFISNAEKKYLFDQIKALVRDQSLMSSEITVLKGKLKAAEGSIFVLKQIEDMKKLTSIAEKKKILKPAAKKPKTAAQKAYQREYMRKYTARKKAEKLALEQK